MSDFKVFHHPDWNWTEINERIESECSDDKSKDNAWYKVSLDWLAILSNALGDGYEVEESNNFILLSSENRKYNRSFLDFSERTLNYIYSNLKSATNRDIYGKRIIIIIHTHDLYQSYVQAFFPNIQDDVPPNGIFIDLGYEHSLFPLQDLAMSEPLLVNHLVGVCLSHLSLPVWLLEGIRSEIINQITGFYDFILSDDLINSHKKYWTSENIKDFWSGDSFYLSDDECHFSMELARILINSIFNIDNNYDLFIEFVKNANCQDSGRCSFLKVYGISLESILNVYFDEKINVDTH